MNSMILSFFAAFFLAFTNAFKKSGVYRIFMKIYSAVSGWWSESVIMAALKNRKREGMSEKSLLYRIIFIPFSVIGAFSKKAGMWIAGQIEKSIIIDLSGCFFNNALALNTRFYGCILLAMLTVRELVSLQFTLFTAVLAVFGILFAVVDYNITDFLANSKAVRFFMSAVGFGDVSFKIYDKKAINRPKALILAVIAGALMGLVSFKSIIFALAILVGFVGLCVVIAYPVCGVFAAVFAAPFVPTMVLAGLCALTFFSLIIKSVINREFKWKLDGVGTGLGFFLVFMLVSCLFSFAQVKSLMVWGMYLIFVGFYFVIINTVETKEQLYGILKVFVIAGALVSLYGVCQYLFGWNTTNAWIDEEMFEEATMRAYSTMENPNVLGEYLLLLIPLSAAFMIKAKKKSFEQVFYGGVLLISILCMVFTQSRGCWLGLILAAFIFVTFYNGKLWGLAPVFLLILPFVIPQTMVDRMLSVGNLEDSSTSYRVFIWLGTIEMMKDFWLGGIGMGEGAFRSVYPLYSYNAIVAPHSHNTFLQLLVEGGIGALLIFVITMIAFLKKMYAVYNDNGKKSMHGILSLAIASGVLGFLLQSMFDYTFYNYRMMAMFFMILAAGALLHYIKEDKADENN